MKSGKTSCEICLMHRKIALLPAVVYPWAEVVCVAYVRLSTWGALQFETNPR